ncbi:MAG: hypothetical protein LUE98_14800 [Tannerellaceae bacterium]|nr:hypothetical protein [Tannerellaceae bacterium]
MQNIFFHFWLYGLFLVCCPAIRGTNSGVFVQAVMENRLLAIGIIIFIGRCFGPRQEMGREVSKALIL